MDKEKIKSRLVFWYSILWIFIFVSLYLSYGVYFIDTASTKSKWVILFSSAVALLLCADKFLEISFYKHKDADIKNEIKAQKKTAFVLYTFKNIIFIIFFSCLFVLSYKFLNLPFAICALSGLILYLFSSEISSHIISMGIVKAKDGLKSSLNEHIKLVFNTNIAVSFLYWGILGAGAVILYHHYKDYEMLIGYACGISAGAYLEYVVNLNLKTPIERVCKTFNQLENIKNLINANNIGRFFESYYIMLICAIVMGANCIGLMGAFLPLIIAANSMFASIIAALIIKINKSNNISKFKLKSALFIVLLNSLMSYLEIHFWLGRDFNSITYSVILGSVIGIIVLFCGRNKKCINELKKIKNVLSNAVFQLFSVLILLSGTVFLAGGMEYALYSMYCVTIAILGFASIIIIPSITNQDAELKNNSRNYLNFSSILIVFCSVISFLAATQVDTVDISDTIIFISLFAGFIVPFICANFGLSNIFFLSRNIMLGLIKQTKTNEIRPNRILLKAACMTVPLILFGFCAICALSYAFMHYIDLEHFFAFMIGIILSSMVLMFKNEPFGSLLRFSCMILLGLEFLFK